MADQETTPEVEVAETAAPNTPVGPDGQPWDFERQQATISKLREFETPAKAYERLSSGEDSEAFAQLAEKYGYELAQEETEAASDWEDPSATEIAALKKQNAEFAAFKEQIELDRQVSAFQNDVARLSQEAEVELSEKQLGFVLAKAANDPKGLSPASTKAAFNDLVEDLKAYEQGFISKHGIKPKAPRKPISGEPASQNPDLNTTADIVAFMQRRMSESEE